MSAFACYMCFIVNASAEYHLGLHVRGAFDLETVIYVCFDFGYCFVCKQSIVALLTIQCVLTFDVAFHVVGINTSRCFLKF